MITAFFAGTALALQPINYEQELLYRATLGAAKDVEIAAKKLTDLNITDSEGHPVLYVAASRVDTEALAVVRVLVENGADVNFAGNNHYYPIIAAVQAENFPVVEYLIQHGASHRARDSAGYSLQQYGKNSTLPEIRDLIGEHFETHMEEEANFFSQETLDKLTYRVAWNACALQYFRYYYDSKQDPIPPAEQERVLNGYQTSINNDMQTLASRFRVKGGQLDTLFEEAKTGIFNEMESLISNRWRRSKGVGQDGDMDKRCDIHAARFKEHYFDAEYQLRRLN